MTRKERNLAENNEKEDKYDERRWKAKKDIYDGNCWF